MAKYFKLEELLTSSTARQKSIENMPSWEVVEHLKELTILLDKLREAWGSSIKITSGFRNEALNKAVGGVSSSVHQIGYAVDMVPGNGRFKEFVEFIKTWLEDKNFDQCIIETSKKSKWVHLSLFNNKHQQRHMIFLMDVK